MAKLYPVKKDGNTVGYHFYCPAGCPGGHFVTVRPFVANNGASWEFNGDLDKPTFDPSILNQFNSDSPGKAYSCHSFVRDGKIQFLNDCTHALAGQTVDLLDAND